MIPLAALRGLYDVAVWTARVDGCPLPRPAREQARIDAAIAAGLVRERWRLTRWCEPTAGGWAIVQARGWVRA